MTEEQKKNIIEYYNKYVSKMANAEEFMDSENKEEEERADETFSSALASQSAIDYTLTILGYTLVVNDEDFAIDIIKEAQQ